MPVLQITFKDGSLTYPIEEGRPIFIGRAKECDIHLPSPSVSRRHAVIMCKDGVCGVKDLNSFNGTLLNDEAITQPAPLTARDVLTIASFIIKVQPDGPPQAGGSARTKPNRATSGRFSNSDLLLPRSMEPEEALERLIEDIDLNEENADSVDETHRFEPGDDTSLFMRAQSDDIADDGQPESGSVVIDNDADDELADELPDSEFSEPRESDEKPGRTTFESEQEQNDAEETFVESALTSAEAEAIIPMNDPDAVETLTLSGDDEVAAQSFGETTDTPEVDEEAPASDDPRFDEEPALSGNGQEEPGWESDEASDDSNGDGDPEDFDGDDMRGSKPERSMSGVDGAVTGFIAFGGETGESGLASVPVSPALEAAITTRLSLYSLLFDLAEQRRLFRITNTNLPAAIETELGRQDQELYNLPSSEDADSNIARLRAKLQNNDYSDGVTGGKGSASLMQAVGEMAISQWRLIRDSNRQDLPAVYKEAYRLAADEPLAQDLTAAGISHGRLLGGAIYLLALEAMSHAADAERRRINGDLRKLSGEVGEKADGLLSRFGRLASNLKNRQGIREETARLEKMERNTTLQSDLAAREVNFVEKTLIREFGLVYKKAAMQFIPLQEEMPLAVRAFLRYGVIGFKPWWLRDEVREFIVADCEDNLTASPEGDAKETGIMYADEYLAAVARMECTPSPDENLATTERNSIAWKADRAFRRIVNSRMYTVLMQETIIGIGSRIQALDNEARDTEERIASLNAISAAGRDALFELQTGQQAVAIRKTNMERYVKRIEQEVVPTILEAVAEAEGRFRKGELPLPDQQTLIEREVDALAEMARHMSGGRERFLPLAIRTQYFPGGDAVCDRGTVRERFSRLERLDPGIFRVTIIPAKKRENRVELHLYPTTVIIPSAGLHCICSIGREGMEGGHLVMPTFFAKPELRNHPKAKREKGLIFNESSDAANWRRVYECHLSDAMNAGRQLMLRNPECYFGIIGKHIDLPDGVKPIRR